MNEQAIKILTDSKFLKNWKFCKMRNTEINGIYSFPHLLTWLTSFFMMRPSTRPVITRFAPTEASLLCWIRPSVDDQQDDLFSRLGIILDLEKRNGDGEEGNDQVLDIWLLDGTTPSEKVRFPSTSSSAPNNITTLKIITLPPLILNHVTNFKIKIKKRSYH